MAKYWQLLESAVSRRDRPILGALWLYASVIAALFFAHSRWPENLDWVASAAAEWVAIPCQIVALALITRLLRGRGVQGSRRRAWWMTAFFAAGAFIATVVWNLTWEPKPPRGISIGDSVYILDYALLTGAIVYFYSSVGGSLRRPRLILDALTITIALVAVLWAFLIAPFMPSAATHAGGFAEIMAYSSILTVSAVAAALLFMQIMYMGDQLAPLLLVCAAVFELGWEIIWMVGRIADRSFAGICYNFGDVICFALIASAAAIKSSDAATQEIGIASESNAYGLLPTLSMLVTIGLLAGFLATSRRWDTWIPMLMGLGGAILLVFRQASVQREIRRLNHALAVRESDARVTELVRCSDDLIVVVNQARALTFVSPAARSMLGIEPEQLKKSPADLILGGANRVGSTALLDSLFGGTAATAAWEATLETPRGPRVLRISGVNQLTNPLIAGIALTISDVTLQRDLEREVINVAARERLRLCSDIHEGLGQELTGIAMLLHGAASSPHRDPQVQSESLRDIVGHVNRTIGIARDLAKELSPIHVARGSLVEALDRLAADLSTRLNIRVEFDSPVDNPPLEAGVADHLYRIAHEAVGNAIRHGGGTRVQIALRFDGQDLTLSVTDNGSGIHGAPGPVQGLGLRMMQYRARIMGGVFRVEPGSPGGTQVSISVRTQELRPPISQGPGPTVSLAAGVSLVQG